MPRSSTEKPAWRGAMEAPSSASIRTGAPVLADNTNSASGDYTTLGMASNPLLWSNGITTRSVNSLTFDPSGGSQIVNMGPVGNVLNVSSGAIQQIETDNADPRRRPTRSDPL